MPSHYAVIKARKGLLLGGAIRHLSCRFVDRAVARDWAETAIKIEEEAGRDAFLEDIVESDLPAEIGRDEDG